MEGRGSAAPQSAAATAMRPYYAGKYPQDVASPMAMEAMDNVPNEMGYYRCRYDGKWYAKLHVLGEGTFSDGSPMVPGDKRFFEVQPIEWYPFDVGEGRRVLISRHVLFVRPFDMNSNVWADSYVRDQLQQFALGCLDSKTKAHIVELPLDNDSVGQPVSQDGRSWVLDAENAPWSVQPVTWDGVFLLSRDEMQGLQCVSRPFAPTDYAMAMGAIRQPNGFGTGWLRTADSAADRAAVFGFDDPEGGVYSLNTGADITRELGVLPVVSLSV